MRVGRGGSGGGRGELGKTSKSGQVGHGDNTSTMTLQRSKAVSGKHPLLRFWVCKVVQGRGAQALAPLQGNRGWLDKRLQMVLWWRLSETSAATIQSLFLCGEVLQQQLL